jgi:Peptidase A4 family
MRRGSVLFACLAVALVAPAGARAQAPFRTHLFQPAPAASGSGRHAATTSLNWAGYAATGKTFTGVTGTWVVPTVGPAGPGFSATWVGIGGYASGDQSLIQAGTEQDAFPGASYNAWYELLPASETPITSGCTGDSHCTVRPGDRMTVTITNTGGNNWTFSMSDAGHWSWTKNVTYASSRSSAEWVHEAPTIGFSAVPVGFQSLIANSTVTFDPNSSYQAGSSTWSSLSTAPKLDQIDLAFVEATTSALDADHDGFRVCAYSLSCAAPGS